MTFEDKLQQHIVEYLSRAGYGGDLPEFAENEAIDFLSCAIQPDVSHHIFTNDRETALLFKAMIDLLRARKHVGIAFHRQHMFN